MYFAWLANSRSCRSTQQRGYVDCAAVVAAASWCGWPVAGNLQISKAKATVLIYGLHCAWGERCSMRSTGTGVCGKAPRTQQAEIKLLSRCVETLDKHKAYTTINIWDTYVTRSNNDPKGQGNHSRPDGGWRKTTEDKLEQLFTIIVAMTAVSVTVSNIVAMTREESIPQ